MEKILRSQFHLPPIGWKIVDQQQELYMVHYNNDADLNQVGHVRGLVLDPQNNIVVADSFGCPQNIVVNSLPPIKDGKMILLKGGEQPFIINLGEHYRFRIGFEGSLVRAFWYHGQFWLSSHRTMDASQCYWGKSPAFKDIYTQLGGPTPEMLFDTTKLYSPFCHFFLLVHPELLSVSKLNVGQGFIVYLGFHKLWEPELSPFSENEIDDEVKFPRNLTIDLDQVLAPKDHLGRVKEKLNNIFQSTYSGEIPNIVRKELVRFLGEENTQQFLDQIDWNNEEKVSQNKIRIKTMDDFGDIETMEDNILNDVGVGETSIMNDVGVRETREDSITNDVGIGKNKITKKERDEYIIKIIQKEFQWLKGKNEKKILSSFDIDIEMVNQILHSGLYQQPPDFNYPDSRLYPGEFVICQILDNEGNIVKTINFQSIAYSWRQRIRSNFPDLRKTFYVLSQDIHLEPCFYSAKYIPLHHFSEKEVIHQLDHQGIVFWPLSIDSKNFDPYYNIWANLMLVVPLNQQKEVFAFLHNLSKEIKKTIQWIDEHADAIMSNTIDTSYLNYSKNLIKKTFEYMEKEKRCRSELSDGLEKVMKDLPGSEIYHLVREIERYQEYHLQICDTSDGKMMVSLQDIIGRGYVGIH